jgi:hypothetical protein
MFMPRSPLARRIEAWRASLSLRAEKRRLIARGVVLAGAVSFVAAVIEIRSRVFETDLERSTRAFLARNDAVQAQQALNLAEFAGCYTAGWAVFITEGTQIISYLPSKPKGPLHVKWSTAQVLRDAGGQVEFKLPAFMYDGPEGFMGSGENTVRVPARPGQRERLNLWGLVSIEVQTLLSADYRTVFVLGLRPFSEARTSGCFEGATASDSGAPQAAP